MPIPCPAGLLNALEGAPSFNACKPCPVGSYCRGDGNWKPDGRKLWPRTSCLSSSFLKENQDCCVVFEVVGVFLFLFILQKAFTSMSLCEAPTICITTSWSILSAIHLFSREEKCPLHCLFWQVFALLAFTVVGEHLMRCLKAHLSFHLMDLAPRGTFAQKALNLPSPVQWALWIMGQVSIAWKTIPRFDFRVSLPRDLSRYKELSLIPPQMSAGLYLSFKRRSQVLTFLPSHLPACLRMKNSAGFCSRAGGEIVVKEWDGVSTDGT